MLYFILILLILVVLGLAAALTYLTKNQSTKNNPVNEQLAVLLERINGMNRENSELRTMIDQKLSETHAANRAQFGQSAQMMQGMAGQSAKMIAEVTEKLTKIEEAHKQVVNFTAQLKNLQDILKNPKQRGILGEYFLEETLKNVLPPESYQMQYKFQSGEIVDAVVFVKDQIIPIDSKFSLENYEKLLNTKDAETKEKYERAFKDDLKKRIDETAKYILPQEHTMDFAFMFVPSEAIYYDLLTSKIAQGNINSHGLIEYAFREKHVIIVSPTSFLAYLQTVLQGLRALKIEEGALSIRANVEKLGQHLVAYDDYLKKMGGSLSTTVNHYNNAYKEFKKVDKDVARVTGGEAEVEILTLDRPNVID